jgi:ankyrin repeat protein
MTKPSNPRLTLPSDDPVVVDLTLAIRGGDVDALRGLLDQHPGLADASIAQSTTKARTPLHLVTDWPGYFPNGPAITRLLLDHGADPNVAMVGRFPETPLHSAASSDDLDVAVVLVDGGAAIDTLGGCIGGGPPLDNAVAFGCWNVARLLVERGAEAALWHAAALGMLARVEAILTSDPPPQEQLNEAFWQACHGGQLRVAQLLLTHGAELNAVPGYSDETPLDTARSYDTRRETLIGWLTEQGAESKPS